MLSRSGDLITGVNEAPLRAGPASFGSGERPRPPEQAWLQSPCVSGCPGMGCGWFLGSRADVQPLPCTATPSAGTCVALCPPCQEGIYPGDAL